MSEQDDRRPVWLLDIDGVVNALGRGSVLGIWPEQAWLGAVVRAMIPRRGPMVLPIMAARPVLDFVAEVVRADAVEVRWHSTWREAAVTELAPVLGLPDIPVSVAPEWTDPPPGVWWKLPAAQRVVAAGRRLVWTDDDLAVLGDGLGSVSASPDALLLSPDPRTGLAAADLDRIRRFLAG